MRRLISFVSAKGIPAPILIGLVALALLVRADPAAAQATRTWVSGVGDDANPCSRTAPCKTFAGAISKTAAQGEIDCLDPGGFGAVTITKAITIDCSDTLGGIVVPGTQGIIVNAGVNDVVTLRGLDINGAGTGTFGIEYLNGGAVLVQKCSIYGFSSSSNGRGIFAPGGATTGVVHQLFVSDSDIYNNGIGSSTGGGVVLGQPTGAVNPGALRAAIDNVRMDRNNIGLRATPNTEATITNSRATGNISENFIAVTSGGQVFLNIDHSTASESVGGIGVQAFGSGAFVRLNDSSVYGNATGVSFSSGGVVQSFGNNAIFGNFGGTQAPSTVPLS